MFGQVFKIFCFLDPAYLLVLGLELEGAGQVQDGLRIFSLREEYAEPLVEVALVLGLKLDDLREKRKQNRQQRRCQRC